MVPTHRSVATIHRARVRLALAPRIASITIISSAFVFPRGITRATDSSVCAALLPGSGIVVVSVLIVWNSVAMMLMILALKRTSAMIFRLAVAAPRGMAKLLPDRMAWAAAIHGCATHVCWNRPVRFSSGKVGDVVAILLVHSTCDWARIRFRSAPTVVVNSINTLLLPLRVTGAACIHWSTRRGSRRVKIRFTICQIGIMETNLLVHSTCDWARIHFWGAPTVVVDGINTLVLPLCIARAGRRV
mgnify:CR=1 FL=1